MSETSTGPASEAAPTREQVHRLRSRIVRLEKRHRRLRKWVLIVASPVLVLLSPILVPIALLRLARRAARSREQAVAGAAVAARPAKHNGLAPAPRSTERTIIFDAFLRAREGGHGAAIDLLDAHADLVPPGGRAIFEAIAAEDDPAWEAAMNRWTVARGLPRPRLAPGEIPRFHRMSFDPMPPAPAPDLITVIVPCFNAEAGVERAVRSILAQTWRNIEVIAVDDASRDATASILDRLAAEDGRLRVLRNDRNVGPFVSKNRALRLASGRYVTGHDADDIAFPDWLAVQMQPMLNNAGIKATVGTMVRLDIQGRLSFPARTSRISHDGVERVCHVSMLIERDVLTTFLGAWNSVRFGADSEMIARVGDLLGDGLHLVRRPVMLCLTSADGLTGDADHGVDVVTGLSPTRRSYQAAWRAWHGRTAPDDRYLPFPPSGAHFQVPDVMLVPEEDIRAVISEDETASLDAMRWSEATASAGE